MSEYVQSARPILLLEWWKPVPGYESRYEVSNVGNICGLRSNGPYKAYTHIKVTLHRQWGRRYINLFDGDKLEGNKRRAAKIYKIMAEAFMGGTPEGMTVNHIDGVRTWDKLSNLEFLSMLDNIEHALRLGLNPKGEKIGSAKLTEDKVREARLLIGTMSLAAIGRKLGVSETAIRHIKNRETWTHVV